jgi:hypothetical protein
LLPASTLLPETAMRLHQVVICTTQGYATHHVTPALAEELFQAAMKSSIVITACWYSENGVRVRVRPAPGARTPVMDLVQWRIEDGVRH